MYSETMVTSYIVANVSENVTLIITSVSESSAVFNCRVLSTLKMDIEQPSEALVTFYEITWYHIPEDNNFHSHNFK
jgi:hypothetical protein